MPARRMPARRVPARQALLAAATLALGAAALAPSPARAVHMDGDGYLNDAQKNPRFIEPYAWQDPARYRVWAPYEGRQDRIRAERWRGDVRVRLYGG